MYGLQTVAAMTALTAAIITATLVIASVVTVPASIITFNTFLGFFILLSFIPIGFQCFVMYYTLKIRPYIGSRSFWLMIALSITGLAYDATITYALAARINADEPITILSLFFGFIFPLTRSGLLLWLAWIMAKGLTYESSPVNENKSSTSPPKQDNNNNDGGDDNSPNAK